MAKNLNIALFSLLLAGTLTAAGCLPRMRMGKGTPPAKYLETFFKGDGEELYFVKPFEWRAKEGKGEVTMDLTHNFKIDSVTGLTVNFTFGSEEPVKKLDAVSVKVGEGEVEGTAIERIFVEPAKKGYRNRYTFQMTWSGFEDVFGTETPELKLQHKGGTFSYIPKKKWNKVREYIGKYMITKIQLARETDEE